MSTLKLTSFLTFACTVQLSGVLQTLQRINTKKKVIVSTHLADLEYYITS